MSYRPLVCGVLVLLLSNVLRAEERPRLIKHYDIPFASISGQQLKLDLVVPAGEGPHPCVICWHGGAWKAGSRKDLSESAPVLDFGTAGKSLLEIMAEKGFVAVSASYRLAPKSIWPAQIQDAKTAIRFLREHAEKYQIDPNRIAAMGFSAGGHLAALAGTAQQIPEFEGKLYAKQSSKVSCVVDFFGPADLTLFTETPGIDRAFMEPLFGGPSNKIFHLIKQASPLFHVSSESVPFLIMHGTLDVVVPIKHSELLHKKLRAAGVKSELVRMPFRGHGWTGEAAANSLDQALNFMTTELGTQK